MIAYEYKVNHGEQGVEEDLMFHLTIAEASKNSVLKSLMLIITPDIINNFINLDICKDGRSYQSLNEHKEILDHIIAQDSEKAAESMRIHLDDVIDYSRTLK